MTVRALFVALGVVSAFALTPATGRGQTATPETTELARELMRITLVDQLQRQVVQQSWLQVEALIRQTAANVTDAQLDALKAEYATLMQEDIRKTTDAAPEIYAKYFSAEELRDILAFYRTPTGKKSIDVMPALATDLMQTLTPQMIESAKRMQEAFLRVLRDKGIEVPAPPR